MTICDDVHTPWSINWNDTLIKCRPFLPKIYSFSEQPHSIIHQSNPIYGALLFSKMSRHLTPDDSTNVSSFLVFVILFVHLEEAYDKHEIYSRFPRFIQSKQGLEVVCDLTSTVGGRPVVSIVIPVAAGKVCSKIVISL